MSWTLCTINDAIDKAGANTNLETSGSDTFAAWSDEAESIACDLARYDVVTNYASLTANGKNVFKSFCSAYVAQKIINYEPSAIGVSEATLRLNVLENDIVNAKKLMEEDKVKTYLGVT